MVKIISAQITPRKLDPQEELIGSIVMKKCLEVKQGEKVLVLTDTLKEKIEAPIFFEAAKRFTSKVKMAVMKPTGGHGREPLKKAKQLILSADIVLAPTAYSLTHTQIREKATKQGCRFVSMPGITKKTILRALDIDYEKMSALSKKIAGLLTAASKAELTSPSGTKMFFNLRGRVALADTGIFTNKGDFGNLPAGEAFIAPVESKAEGILVYDLLYGEQKLSRPVAFKVEKGRITKVCCKTKEALKIEKTLNQVGPLAQNIAELGVGTNPQAGFDSGILELEKIYGTVHVALGNNVYFGGEIDVPYHVDGLVVNPILKLDGKKILENNKFLI